MHPGPVSRRMRQCRIGRHLMSRVSNRMKGFARTVFSICNEAYIVGLAKPIEDCFESMKGAAQPMLARQSTLMPGTALSINLMYNFSECVWFWRQPFMFARLLANAALLCMPYRC
jgi:hypothetical protein